MKIITLINQPYPNMTGGSANKLLGEVKYLHKKKHEVHIIAARGGNSKLRLKDSEKCASLSHVGLPYIPLGTSKHIFLLFKMLLGFLSKLSYFIFAFFKSLTLIKGTDVISIKGIHGDGLCGVLLKKIFHKRLVFEHAGGLNQKRAKLFKQMKKGKYLTRLLLWFNTLTERIVYRNCDAIMTQEDVEDYYRKLGFKGEYHIIQNGRDTEKYYPQRTTLKKEHGIKGKVILFVGRFVPVKNINKIIKAFDLLDDGTSLVLVGDGELRDELQDQARKNNYPENIYFMGHQDDVTPYYNIADILVIASDYEGLPGVLVEAMACGKTVVASPVGVIPKVIDGSNGYLLPSKWDENDLVEGMILGLNSPYSVRKKSKKTFDENYSWEVVIEKFIRIYNPPLGGTS